MIGNFMLKQILHAKLQDVPAAEQARLLALLERNPELFKSIAVKAKEHMDAGKNQMEAIMEAVRAHEAELRKITS